jgi:hypothetical protein
MNDRKDQRVSTSITVARYHLANPVKYLVTPWGVLAFTFALCAIVFALVPASQHTFLGGPATVPNVEGRYTNILFTIFFFFFVLGVQSVAESLSFALTLGASRRSFYSGTALLGASLALASGLVLAGLQAIERATGGWGMAMHFFRVPHLLDGPWYVTWLSSFVGLSVLFVYGMWYGAVYRRWGVPGISVFIAVQALVGLAVYAAVAVGYSWAGVEGHLASLSALDLTGFVAGLAVVLLVGGHATIRRVTV